MTLVVGGLTVLLLSSVLGLFLLERAYGLRAATLIVGLSQGASLAATAYRFRSEVLHDEFASVHSDTYRYLAAGRERWLTEQPLAADLVLGDGTDNTIILSQGFFTVFGDHAALVFLAASTLGLIGLWLIALAIRTARPDAPEIFGYLVCLIPSAAYWSSSFGKDAFTFLAVGACLWAVADIAARGRARPTPVLAAVLAIILMLLVRIDVGIVLLLAWLISSGGVRTGGGALFRRGAITAVFVGAPVALLTAALLGWDDPLGIVSSFSGTHERTSIGGSAIADERPGGLTGFAVGVLTAIFRPFPWEHGLGGLISSVDVLVFVAVAVVGIRALRRGHHWRLPEARLMVFGSLVVLSVFSQLSQFANLGLLVRLRSLIIPVVLLAIAMLIERAQEARPVERPRRPAIGRRPTHRMEPVPGDLRR